MVCPLFEKCGKIWKNGRFSGRLWPDWGNTTRAATAGLGSIGYINYDIYIFNNTVVYISEEENNKLHSMVGMEGANKFSSSNGTLVLCQK